VRGLTSIELEVLQDASIDSECDPEVCPEEDQYPPEWEMACDTLERRGLSLPYRCEYTDDHHNRLTALGREAIALDQIAKSSIVLDA